MTTCKAIISVVIYLTFQSKTIDGLNFRLVTKESDETTLHSPSNLRKSFLSSLSDPKSIEAKKTGGMCDGYDGILKINTGDRFAASGTSFFVYVINQIMYAEQHNLIPWVHFTDARSAVYDVEFHDEAPRNPDGDVVSFKALLGKKISDIVGRGDLECLDGQSYPGPLEEDDSQLPPRRHKFTLETSGVWEHYFEPISPFQPHNMNSVDVESCASKYFVEHLPHQIVPGLQICAPWGVRSWHYQHTPKANSPIEGESRSIHNWLGRMRHPANAIVAKYIHPKPWLLEKVNDVNPIIEGAPPCLAIHIRHTDKANGRVRIPLEAFLPFAERFVANGGERIYVATDSLENIERIESEWPRDVSSKVRRQTEAFYSSSRKPAFYLVSHHQSNTEALVDIYAMSRCGLLLHGYSAMTEAVVYINGKLHYNSVNLDDPDHPDLDEFANMLQNVVKS